MDGRLPEPGKEHLVPEAIDTVVRYFLFLWNVLSFESVAKDVLFDYQMRDSVDYSFKGVKTCSELDVVRTHSNASTDERFI